MINTRSAMASTSPMMWVLKRIARPELSVRKVSRKASTLQGIEAVGRLIEEQDRRIVHHGGS